MGVPEMLLGKLKNLFLGKIPFSVTSFWEMLVLVVRMSQQNTGGAYAKEGLQRSM